MPAEFTYIYGLCDPEDNAIRYVGKANNPKSRLGGHICTSRRKTTKLCSWIKGIVDRGEKPSMKILERVPVDEWKLAERRWISELSDSGSLLFNISPGGNQLTRDPKKKKMWRLKQKMGVLLKQGYVSESTKEKLRAAYQLRPELFTCFKNV